MGQKPNLPTTEFKSRSPQGFTGPIWLHKTVIGVCLFLICLGFAGVTPLFAEPPSTFTITKHKNLFSAHIIGARLEEVLASLISYVPIKFFITGNAKNDLISASFSNEPLEKTLEHLLNGYDYAIRSRRLNATSETSNFRYLTEVEIISRDPTDPSSTSPGRYSISSPPSSVQSTLEQPTHLPEIHNQETPLNFETASDAGDFQAALQEAFQDDEPESRALVKELMQELATGSE